jgi:hypothetical protein
MAVTTGGSSGSTGLVQDLHGELVAAARTLGTISALGVLCGWLVVGVLSRLAMFLLAVLNPVATGVTSDDGFVMGQFTVSGSLNLLLVAGTFLGIVGAGFYTALRGLAIGPRWFRLLSLSLGGGVVVGSQVVHVDGVDFRLLEPLWLAVGLFVLLPALYVALLAVVSEWALARPSPVPRTVVVLGLAAWVVMVLPVPLLVALTTGFVSLRLLDRTGPGHRVLSSPVVPWLLRAGLAVLFVLAVADLVNDVSALS